MAENMIVIFFTRGKINQTVGRGAGGMKGGEESQRRGRQASSIRQCGLHASLPLSNGAIMTLKALGCKISRTDILRDHEIPPQECSVHIV